MGYASNYREAQEQAVREYDYELMRSSQHEGIFMVGAVVLYIVTLFVPIIAVNLLIIWFFNIINWAYNFKVIGWLIGIGGTLFLLSIIWQGIFVSAIFIGSLVEKIKANPNKYLN